MRLRTLVVLVVVVVALAGLGAFAVAWGTTDGGGTLSTVWTSDTGRSTDFNHHGVGVGSGLRGGTGVSAGDGGDGNTDVVVAPVLEQGGAAELTNESCSLARLDPGDGDIRWRYGVPPDRCFVHSLTKPAVADLDGDDRRELVVGTVRNETVVLDANGSEQFAIPAEAYGYARPTVADLDGDGGPEIVTSDVSGAVAVADADGTVRWRGNVSSLVYDSPIVTDLDGDADDEVVVASREEVVAFERNGSVRWRRGVSGNDVAVASTGERTVVVAVGHDGVVALDGGRGTRLWNRSAAGTPSLASIADADGDGTPEAFVSVAGNRVRALELPDGDRDWETRLAASDATTPPAVLTDVSGDGSPELLAPTNGGTVVVLDPATGAELAAFQRNVPIWTSVTPADLTDSPGREVLVTYGDGRVVALEYSE